jgi:hypothetical protein
VISESSGMAVGVGFGGIQDELHATVKRKPPPRKTRAAV